MYMQSKIISIMIMHAFGNFTDSKHCICTLYHHSLLYATAAVCCWTLKLVRIPAMWRTQHAPQEASPSRAAVQGLQHAVMLPNMVTSHTIPCLLCGTHSHSCAGDSAFATSRATHGTHARPCAACRYECRSCAQAKFQPCCLRAQQHMGTAAMRLCASTVVTIEQGCSSS